MLLAAAAGVSPGTAAADSLFPVTREHSATRTFEITACGAASTRSVILPQGAYAVRALRPAVGAVLGEGVYGDPFARVSEVVTGSDAGRTSLLVTAVGSDTACEGQSEQERADCERYGESCPVLGTSEPLRLTARYTRRERVYVTGSGRGGPRSYKPRVLPFGMRSAIIGLRWRRWGSPRAVGRGRVQFNNCIPDCARARPSYYPVRAVLSRRRECEGHAQYLTLRFRYTTSARPPGLPATYRESFGWRC
jgi:hypothetical protein